MGTGVLSRVKVAGVHKPPSIAEFTNEWSYTSTVVLISPYPDQEGNKISRMSGTRAISKTSRRELSSDFFFLARQGAEGN